MLAALLSVIGGVAAAHAQGPPCRGPGWGAYGPYQRIFDRKAVQTIQGTIVAVDRTNARDMWQGIHVRVRTASETVDVHLGPAWFVDTGEIALAAGSRVQITGSRVKYQGKPLLIAMSLTRGEMTLRLRDADGFPYWAGWRQRVAPRPGWRDGPRRPR